MSSIISIDSILPFEIMNKIFYEHKGLSHPTAIIINKAFKKIKEDYHEEFEEYGFSKNELWNKLCNYEFEYYQETEDQKGYPFNKIIFQDLSNNHFMSKKYMMSKMFYSWRCEKSMEHREQLDEDLKYDEEEQYQIDSFNEEYSCLLNIQYS